VASSLHTLVHSAADPNEGLRPLVGRMNRYLHDFLPAHSFVTLVALIVDPETGAFEHVNAGHPPALLLRANGELSRLPSGRNIALGIADDVPCAQQGELRPGDTLFLHSDGITEGAAVPAHRVQRRLVHLLRKELSEQPLQSAAELEARVSNALTELRGARIANDDTTFLIARRVQPRRGND
jgi:serine phosphatase RsbU (regulator of sigma subunit)